MQRSFPRSLLLLLAGILLVSGPSPVRGEFNLRSELTNQFFLSTLRDKITGEKTDTSYVGLFQRNNIFLARDIYPYLSVQGGGNFDIDFSRFEVLHLLTTDTTETRLSPFGQITLDNPEYKAGFWYSQRLLDTNTTGIPNENASLEEWNAYLGWKPGENFEVNGRYFQSHAVADPNGADLQENRILADMRYVPFDELQLSYQGSVLQSRDLRLNTEGSEQNHNGRVEFTRQFINNRFLVNASYNLQYLSLSLPASGNQGRLLPVPRVAAFFSINNNPAAGEVSTPVPTLIDGNVSASTGIDIGLDGDEISLTNMAVDLGTATAVDAVYLWVDRPLSSSVANSFTWSVYVSPDNTVTSSWTLVATVVPAEFGPFENRFAIPFPETETRFIKVVTRPLALTVPDAINYPNIFVTEMEVFRSIAPGEGDYLHEEWLHNTYLNLRGRLGDRTNCGYNFYFLYRDQMNPDEIKDEFSNGIYLTHVFNDTFSVNANASRVDTTLAGDLLVNYYYSAALKAAYLPTLSQSLIYSGYVEEDVLTTWTHSVFLRNNADLFRGWTLFVDVGYLRETGDPEKERSNLIVRTGSEVRPNEKITLTLNYSGILDVFSGGPVDDTQNQLDVQAFLLPTRNLSLFARIGIVTDPGVPVQVLQNYSANWSPFPDGDLQFLFTYTEALGTGDAIKERTFGPGFKWKIGLHAYLTFYYNRIRTETETLVTEADSVTSKIRIQF
jgi:hypothetical protein